MAGHGNETRTELVEAESRLPESNQMDAKRIESLLGASHLVHMRFLELNLDLHDLDDLMNGLSCRGFLFFFCHISNQTHHHLD